DREGGPEMPRLRPPAADEAVHSPHPRRCEGRDPHPAQGKGRAGDERRAVRRSRGRHACGRLAAVRAPRRRPRRQRAGDLLRGGARRERRGAHAGGKAGTRMRLQGKGEARTSGGPSGDLEVVTRAAASPLYERRGAHLVVNVPVTYSEAALGASVEVPTPEGPVSLKVPAGSEDGKLLRIRGRGAPKLSGSGKGDVLARLRIAVPKKLTKREREALEELQRVERGNPRDRLFNA